MLVAEEFLLRQQWTTAVQIAGVRQEIIHEIEAAVAQVQREPAPDPYEQEWRAISSQHLSEGNPEH